MNRPCYALSILLASLAGSLMAVGSAKSDTRHDAAQSPQQPCHLGGECGFGISGHQKLAAEQPPVGDRFVDDSDYTVECLSDPNSQTGAAGEDYTYRAEDGYDDYADDYTYDDYDYDAENGEAWYGYDYGYPNDDGIGHDEDNYDYGYSYEYDYGYPDDFDIEREADANFDAVHDVANAATNEQIIDELEQREMDCHSGYDRCYDDAIYGENDDRNSSQPVAAAPANDPIQPDAATDTGSANDSCDDSYWSEDAERIAGDFWCDQDYWREDIAANDEVIEDRDTFDVQFEDVETRDTPPSDRDMASDMDVVADETICDWQDDYYWAEEYYWDDEQVEAQPANVDSVQSDADVAPHVITLQSTLDGGSQKRFILLVAKTLNRVGLALQNASQDLERLAGENVADLSPTVDGAASQR